MIDYFNCPIIGADYSQLSDYSSTEWLVKKSGNFKRHWVKSRVPPVAALKVIISFIE